MRDIRNLPLRQSRGSYIRTLQELERRVLADEPLEYYDCTEPGITMTECSLGLCADSVIELQDGIHSDEDQPCPHDKRFINDAGEPTGERGEVWGCFYHCRIFQTPNPSKSKAQDRIRKIVARTTTSK
jgi:hypothetical protein